MSVTGEPDGEPMKYGVAIADLTTAMTGCASILAAIHNRDRTGRGHRVDLSLLETVVGWLIHLSADYLATGQLAPRIGNGHSSIVPYQTFKASDRYFAFGALNDRQFRDFSRVLGHPEWPDDPRFKTNPDRVAHRAELIPMLEAVLHTRTASEWVDALLEVIKPKPDEDRWAMIAWRTDLWQARREAAAKGKPILLWEMDGHPLGCV